MKNIKDLKDGDNIHCKTQAEWDAISALMGKTWNDAKWEHNKEKSIIYPKRVTYSHLEGVNDRNTTYNAPEFLPEIISTETQTKPVEFEVGKFARCVTGSSTSLTKNKLYKIIDTFDIFLNVINDSGHNEIYLKNRFEPTDITETSVPEPDNLVRYVNALSISAPKFRIGNYVRISTGNSTDRVYTIINVHYTSEKNLYSYFLSNKRIYFERDLEAAPKPPELPEGYKWPDGIPAFTHLKHGDEYIAPISGLPIKYNPQHTSQYRYYKIEKIEDFVPLTNNKSYQTYISNNMSDKKPAPSPKDSVCTNISVKQIGGYSKKLKRSPIDTAFYCLLVAGSILGVVYWKDISNTISKYIPQELIEKTE